jgi:hypothetical protein
MRALVVVESWFGNTRAVAEAVADGLGGAEVCDVGSAPARVEADVALLVVGGPTHAFGMTRAQTRAEAVRSGAPGSAATCGLRDWLSTLEAPRGLAVATFDTRVEKVRRLPGSAARSAARVLRRRGQCVVARPRSFYVTGTPGPLLDGELERARAWGADLATRRSFSR